MDLRSEGRAKSKLTRSPLKQRSGWRVCFHRNGSGDRAEHCQLRQYSNDGTTKESNERKGENGKRKKWKTKKKRRKQTRRNKKWRNRREKETGGKKEGKQETTGNIKKQQERERKREETSFAQAISVQTARHLSALPKVISLCVALLRLRKPDHGPQGVECRGRSVQGIMEADFDGSSSAVDEVASSTACSSTQ